MTYEGGERVRLKDGSWLVNDLADPSLFSALLPLAQGRPFVERRISVTQLLSPPQMRRLFKEHAEEIVTPASEMWYRVLGTVFHKILENLPLAEGDLAEQFISVEREVNGETWTVTGFFDRYVAMAEAIKDYKLFSVWEVTFGLKVDKEQQCNLYAHMSEEDLKIAVTRLAISGVCRDWSKTQAGDRHPDRQDHFIRVKRWPAEKCEALLMERLRDHAAETARPCTPEEQWRKEDYAVMKKGRKSAVRKFDTRSEAEAHLAANPIPGAWVEHRQMGATRCASYCPVREFCPQRKKERTQ